MPKNHPRNKLINGKPEEFRYKGLRFVQHIANEINSLASVGCACPPVNCGCEPSPPLFAFYGSQIMTRKEIRECVGLMIERRVYIPPKNSFELC